MYAARMRLTGALAGAVLMLGLQGPVAASPLRVSLHGLDDPGPATTEPGSTAPARFVAADAAPPPEPAPVPLTGRRPGQSVEPDADEAPARPFVRTHELPADDGAPDLRLPRPDDAGGMARLLRGDGAVAVPAPAGERQLGEFAPPPPMPAQASEPGALDGPPPDAEPLPDLPLVDTDALGYQRLAVMLVVVPLVAVVTAVWWRADRRNHRRRSSRRDGGDRRVRARAR